jgi:phosphoadenosine phosphosulfate reductase
MHHLPYNPLYGKGFDRIGCWLCPSCSVADLYRLKETHPEFAAKLESYLIDYAQRSGLSPEWVEHGMWRWKKLPPRLQEIAKSKGISTIPKVDVNNKLEFTVTSGYRPCKQGGVSAEGSFGTAIDLEKIEASGMLEAVGRVAFMEGVVSIFQGEDSAQIFAAGTVTARSDSENQVRQLIKSVELSIQRALHCSGCGVCVGKCSHDVIKMKNGIAIIGEKCIHCGKCINVCPVVKFG